MPLYSYIMTPDLDNPEQVLHANYFANDLNFIWELNGGLQSIEVSLGMSYANAQEFYRRYMGYRFLVVDHFLDIPVADGFITDLALTRTGATLLANGFWFRHSDQLYNFDDTAQATQSGTLNYLTNAFQDIGRDFSAFAAVAGQARYELAVTNTDNSISWGFIGAVSTTTNANDTVAIYTDYSLSNPGWNNSDPSGKTAQSYKVLICYDYLSTTAVIKDALTNEVPAISSDHSNIDEAGTPVGMWEPSIEEGGLYPTEVIDKLASFSDSQNRQWNYWTHNAPLVNGLPQRPVPYFKPQRNDGTYDWNISRRMISKGDHTTSRNMQELRNAVNVIYKNMADQDLLYSTGYAENADSIDKYWRREAIVSGGASVPEVAETYRDMYLDKYKNALLGRGVALSYPWIEDSNGARWPLWAPIKFGKSYFRYTDLALDTSAFSSSWDGKLNGQATTMEYSAAENKLRVVLDTEDNSLAAFLARMEGLA